MINNEILSIKDRILGTVGSNCQVITIFVQIVL